MTADSRILVGTLTAADNSTNLVRSLPSPSSSLLLLAIPSLLTRECLVQVLSSAVERLIRDPDDDEPSSEVPLGLYLVRGDNVCSVGLVDEKLDDSINWTEVKGHAIGGVKHV